MSPSTEGRKQTENEIHRRKNWRTNINVSKGLSVRKKNHHKYKITNKKQKRGKRLTE